jgi:hypothetical protein
LRASRLQLLTLSPFAPSRRHPSPPDGPPASGDLPTSCVWKGKRVLIYLLCVENDII